MSSCRRQTARRAIEKGPAGTTETLETILGSGGPGIVSLVNFSRPYGTSRRSYLYPSSPNRVLSFGTGAPMYPAASR
jgi:hypothetical protein